jgi:hypothetical protein
MRPSINSDVDLVFFIGTLYRGLSPRSARAFDIEAQNVASPVVAGIA